MAWTDERTELLKKLWPQGLSATVIARRIGGVTRNAVIGKVHRIGLADRPTRSRIPTSRRCKPKQPVAPKVQTKSTRVRADGKEFAPVFNVTPLPPEPPKPTKLFKLEELKENQCRFPYGDGITEAYRFCGCDKAPGSQYCPGHLHLCKSPTTPDDRKRSYAMRPKRAELARLQHISVNRLPRHLWRPADLYDEVT